MTEPVTRLRVRVSPGAARSSVVGRHGGGWKIRVAAPPVDGRANDRLVSFLAGILAVDRRRVGILTGGSGRDKIIEIRGCDASRTEKLMAAAAGEREEKV
jgi:uncharacterized protein (TIGR00251 family)